jgi:hypothetical protein
LVNDKEDGRKNKRIFFPFLLRERERVIEREKEMKNSEFLFYPVIKANIGGF